jgi:hypothetical protein
MSAAKEEKQTLAQMLSVLHLMEQQIDTADEITLDMCEEHFAQIKSVDEKVDRLLGYMDLAKRQAAALKERADALRDKAKSWSNKYERLKEYAIYLANVFPEVQGRGNERTYYKRLNPPRLVVDIERKWSTDHALDDETINLVPEEYRTKKEVWVLDTAKLKDDMKIKSLDFSWAHLVRLENLTVEEKTGGK